MKIFNRHGFITFEETRLGEIAQFSHTFGFDIVPFEGSFTLSPLTQVPKYFIKGGLFFGNTLIKTIEGHQSEIMRENKITYDFSTGLFKNINSVSNVVKLNQGLDYFFANGLILPGSLTDKGKRITDYAAWYLFGENNFKYTSIEVI